MNHRSLEGYRQKASHGLKWRSTAYWIQQVETEGKVLDLLCKNAVETRHYDIREALINLLKNNSEAANLRFIDYVLHSPDSGHRRWALVNLSLMECRTAKDAVLKGLRDPDIEVRMAAALNAGLYDDKEVLKALEHFFETSRFACVRNFAALIARQFRQNNRPKMKLDMTCLRDALHSPSVSSV
jgi:hypothetical protein